jgi:NADPH-dependent curcumin reductase CurA
MQGFIIGQDYGHRIAEFQQQMGRWVQEGKIKYRVFEGVREGGNVTPPLRR